MRIHTFIRTYSEAFQDHSYSIICYGAFSVFAAASAFVSWSLFGFQHVDYSYSARTVCTTSPKVLPELFKGSTDTSFQLDRTTSFAFFGLPVYSHSFCVTPTEAPKAAGQQSMRESLLGMVALGKPISIESETYAQVRALTPKDKAVPVDKPLLFALDKPDETFTYYVQANGKSGACTHAARQLSCKLAELGLAHAATYELQVVRKFGDKTLATALKQQTETLTPITIIATSVANTSTVYEQPAQLTFETDKMIAELESFKLTTKDAAGTETMLNTKLTTKDKTITAVLEKPLPRKQTIVTHIDELHATDGSGLAGPYVLSFTTSGGPAVKGTNIGKSTINPSQTITVNFDQPLAVPQDWPTLASLTVNGQAVSAAINAQDNRLVIDPASDFPACSKISIKVTGGIQSNHGVSGDSTWTYNSRARCAIIGSIGTSAGGRAITSYRFGSGSNPVVYIGAIHGNETSAKTLMDGWVSELEANADNIPAGRSIVVIPVTNPDGFASSSRLNRNNVDLNRNFPSNDWKATVTIPGGRTLPAGGGATSLSEPESQALAAFVQRERPRMLMTYHAKASIIEANEAGDSMSAAYVYAKTSRYRAVGKSQNGSFQHDTTGALEDWMRDKLGLPALCIELAAQSGNEFSRNKDALWAMTKL